MSKVHRLIVRRGPDGNIRTVVENHKGRKININGVSKVHFVNAIEPQIVVTFRANDVDAEVEISEEMADAIVAESEKRS